MRVETNLFIVYLFHYTTDPISHWLKKFQPLFSIYRLGSSYSCSVNCSHSLLGVRIIKHIDEIFIWQAMILSCVVWRTFSFVIDAKKRKGKRTSSWPQGVVGREFGQFFFSYISPLAQCNLTLHSANLRTLEWKFNLDNVIFWYGFLPLFVWAYL